METDRFMLSEMQYGPFLPFLKRQDITDIDYNGQELWVRDIHNKRKKVEDREIIKRLTPDFIRGFAQNVGNLVGKNLTPADNAIEAETEELRITVLHESVAVTGTCICIRKTPPVRRITPLKAIEENYCEEKVLHLLANCVKARINMVFCGETGVGKTELLKFLTAFIPPEQKVITVEDTREVHYREINPGKDCVELRVNGYFTYDMAMQEVLRMTPNRVMLSEARGREVQQLVKCWTSGITGFTTLHTDDVRKIPDRILNMMPTREDAERMENDIYIGLQVGVLLDNRYNRETEREERYISQVGFFTREENKNRCVLAVRGGILTEEGFSMPQVVEDLMKKNHVRDFFFCEQLEEMLESERAQRDQKKRKRGGII